MNFLPPTIFNSLCFLALFPIFGAWQVVYWAELTIKAFFPFLVFGTGELNYRLRFFAHICKGTLIGIIAGGLYALPLFWLSAPQNLLWEWVFIGGIIGLVFSMTFGKNSSACPVCRRKFSVHWENDNYVPQPCRRYKCQGCGHSWYE